MHICMYLLYCAEKSGISIIFIAYRSVRICNLVSVVLNIILNSRRVSAYTNTRGNQASSSHAYYTDVGKIERRTERAALAEN